MTRAKPAHPAAPPTHYRTLRVDIADTTPPAVVATALAAFAAEFDSHDIRLTTTNGSVSPLTVHLRALDMTRLRAFAGRSPHASSVFLPVLRAMEKTGSYGVSGGKRIYAGYNDERKVRQRAQKEKKRGKIYYTDGHNFSREENVVPRGMSNRIVCGDSAEIMRRLPDNCVDLIFTSPPYNFGLEYKGAYEDGHDWTLYFTKLFAILDECVRVLKWGGRLVVNVQPLYSDYIPLHHNISHYLMERKMIWKGEILWEKNNYNCKYTAWGSWKSPSSPYLRYTWEFIEVFCKGGLKKNGAQEKIDISADDFKKWVYAKWSVAPERNMQKYGHPAMFPEELALRVMRLFSFRGDFVLDPFNGAGTTTAVAHRTGRNWLGIDISQEYCAIAEGRQG